MMRTLLFLALVPAFTACAAESGDATGPKQATAGEEAAATARTGGRERPVVMSPDDGDVVWFLHEGAEELGSGGELRIYMDHATNPEAMAGFAKFTLGVNGSLPVHRHDKTEEIAYILSGEGVAIGLDEQGNEIELPLAQGYLWYNPPGVWHAVRNTGDVPLALVFATIPNEEKGLLSFFRRIGVEPGREPRAIPAEEFGRLASEHDLILRPPKNGGSEQASGN